MPTGSRTAKPSSRREPAGESVEAFLAALEHPHRPALLALREIIRGVDPAIGEALKWNAPSFHTTEHFATFQLRHRDGAQVVLHLGARPRPDAAVRAGVADPAGLLVWRGADRATATFADLADVAAKRDAFAAVVRRWITFVV